MIVSCTKESIPNLTNTEILREQRHISSTIASIVFVERIKGLTVGRRPPRPKSTPKLKSRWRIRQKPRAIRTCALAHYSIHFAIAEVTTFIRVMTTLYRTLCSFINFLAFFFYVAGRVPSATVAAVAVVSCRIAKGKYVSSRKDECACLQFAIFWKQFFRRDLFRKWI